jgi:hypothetical protein
MSNDKQQKLDLYREWKHSLILGGQEFYDYLSTVQSYLDFAEYYHKRIQEDNKKVEIVQGGFCTTNVVKNETQTAVEWLIEIDKYRNITIEECQQDKEMEKKQIEDAELRSKEIIIIKHTEHEGGNK